jgi:hypothetical protein
MRLLQIFLLLTLWSCQTYSERSAHSEITKDIAAISHKNLAQYKAIFLIPFYGCTGCISNAEGYLISSYAAENKRNILFVVIGHDSYKSARLRLGEDVIRHPDVYVDTEGKFDSDKYLGQFPKLLMLDDGAVVSQKEANYDYPTVYEDLDKIAKL